LGLEIAEWLAAHGAGRIVLGGRRPPAPEATERLVRLRAAGTAVEVLLGDIAEPGVAERLVAAVTAGGLTLDGVAHAAGVLADALMSSVDDAGLDRVWRPKVTGARRLHEATAGHRPGWFLLFSSAAAMFGNPGQASYAAANAWLDGFAFWRRQQGLPATSVNWGPWSGLGMAAGIGHRGHAMIDPVDGIAALETILDHDCTRVGVFPFDPRELLRVLPTAAGSPFFAAMPMPETGTGRTGGPPTAAALAALPPERRGPALIAQLGTHIDAILGAGTAGDDPNAPLVHAGLDSLTAMQLRSRLETDLGLAIPTAAVWTYPSVAALARYLLGRLRLADGSARGSDGRTAGWFVRPVARPAAAVRLVAFPYLGGGASAYRAWAEALPAGVELYAVQLPGREHRADEPFATDLHALAAEVAGALAGDADPRPYALFGHSGGALLAYETARALRRLGAPAPVLLVVSAMLPPHHPRWATQIRAALLERPAEEIAALGADRPGPLDDPAVAAALLPAVRADAALYAGYAHESEAPLDCPVVAYTGTEDPLYRPAEVAGWRSVTTARTSTRSYPGGHFYFRHQTAQITADLGADLSAAGDAGDAG
jgi:surfactin synthase thioesterase subunit/acyl carrier protein